MGLPPFGSRAGPRIGLAIGDQLVRRLLGALPMPELEHIEARAERTAEQFLDLFG